MAQTFKPVTFPGILPETLIKAMGEFRWQHGMLVDTEATGLRAQPTFPLVQYEPEKTTGTALAVRHGNNALRCAS
jgi:hypothetical protein